MRNKILLLGCLAVVLGATPEERGGVGPSMAGGGTPRFSEDTTWCAVGDTEAVCRLTVVGVGRKQDTAVTLDVLAQKVFSCVAAGGRVVRERTGKMYIGNMRQVFRSDMRGRVEEVVRGSVELDMLRDVALACPPSYELVPGSEATETSWQLTAVGHRRAGLFNAAYTSM